MGKSKGGHNDPWEPLSDDDRFRGDKDSIIRKWIFGLVIITAVLLVIVVALVSL